MSAWKKASKVNQKVYRDRSQLQSREHLGLLEKKKDYKLRSNNFHEREDTLKLLHKKALNKNPDEFYHHMIKSRIKEDEHHEFKEPDEHTKEQLALMETQDVKYIIMKRTIEGKKIQRLQAELHMIDSANEIKNKHIFFVEDDKEAKNFDLAKRLDTHPSLLNRKANRPRLDDLQKLKVPDVDDQTLSTLAKKREAAYKELEKRIEREKELSVVQQKLELKRLLKQKRLTKPKKIKKGTKNAAPVYKFPYERKR